MRAFVEQNPIAPGRHTATARAALERRTIHLHDVRADPDETDGAKQIETIRTVLVAPMLRAGELLGAIQVYRHEVRPFTDGQVALLETFADQAVIAIENARLLGELQAKNADLTEALEQQTATSEILRVISSSPTNVQPVFDAVAESAARLCDAFDVTIFRREDAVLRLVAHHGAMPAGPIGEFSVSVNHTTVGGRSVLHAQTLHLTDVQAEVDQFPEAVTHARRFGHRAMLSVPLLRD